MGYGIVGLIILILDIIAILDVAGSGMDPAKKLIWILLILFLPVIGLILWYLVGKKGAV